MLVICILPLGRTLRSNLLRSKVVGLNYTNPPPCFSNSYPDAGNDFAEFSRHETKDRNRQVKRRTKTVILPLKDNVYGPV